MKKVPGILFCNIYIQQDGRMMFKMGYRMDKIFVRQVMAWLIQKKP